MTAAITSNELRERIASATPLWILDVRTPSEFETAHIDGSLNVPLDVLNEHGSKVAEQLDQSHDIVLVCRSGQRATQAWELLQRVGVDGGSVLENGISDWEGRGYDVNRGIQRWDLERQVRLVGRIDRAVFRARKHRDPTTEVAGRGHWRRPDVCRRLQHLRDGNGVVEAAVQPRCVNRYRDCPLPARVRAERQRSRIAIGSNA